MKLVQNTDLTHGDWWMTWAFLSNFLMSLLNDSCEYDRYFWHPSVLKLWFHCPSLYSCWHDKPSGILWICTSTVGMSFKTTRMWLNYKSVVWITSVSVAILSHFYGWGWESVCQLSVSHCCYRVREQYLLLLDLAHEIQAGFICALVWKESSKQIKLNLSFCLLN